MAQDPNVHIIYAAGCQEASRAHELCRSGLQEEEYAHNSIMTRILAACSQCKPHSNVGCISLHYSTIRLQAQHPLPPAHYQLLRSPSLSCQHAAKRRRLLATATADSNGSSGAIFSTEGCM